jgi:glycosyltransferase involved in cell wall biosynthesis
MRTLLSVFGVEPRRIGGTEMFARELSQQLGERGWQSVLCFLSEPSGDVRRFMELPNVSFAALPNSTNGDREARANLKALLRQIRPDILHLHYVSFVSWYPWTARLKSVPNIFFTDHHSRPDGYVPQRARIWKRAAARMILHPLTKVICVSNYGYQCMTAPEFLPRDRFEMIYNGVDLSRVQPDNGRGAAFRRRFSIPAERKIVTQVSWIIPEKGIADFIEMARLVSAQRGDAHFVLVGDGAQRDQYIKDAAAKGLADRITWTGTIDDPFGEGVFAAADVVCQFSRWEEVFGWMIAEAMAHGKPVVATRVGGIPELIGEGKSGFLVDRGDTEAMRQRVLQLLNDDDARARMGALGREIVQTKFDLSKHVTQLIRSYGIGAREESEVIEATPARQIGNQPALEVYSSRRPSLPASDKSPDKIFAR